METISPQPSPTASISPPVTPFSIALPHTYALPPLKTLPTWNRTKFKDGKLLRSVPKNKNIKVELIGRIGQIENCTQTSPPSSSSESLSSLKVSSCRKSANNTNRLRKSFDKKIVFLETTHKEVLSNLHQELEKIKSQNRALKFQLVMAGEVSSEHQVDNDEKADAQIAYNNSVNIESEESKLLKGEIRELKKLLGDADSKNIYLTKLMEQLKQRSSASRLHSGNHKTKTVPRNKSDYSMPLNNIQQRHSSAKIVLKQIKSNVNDMEDDIYGESMQVMKEKQNELIFLEEKVQEQKLQEQNLECNVIFPKLDQLNNRSGPVPINSSAVNRLYKRMQEPISLPVLQGLPGNRNMTLRQKRAQALHVQRQRSNKNVTLTAATAINNA